MEPPFLACEGLRKSFGPTVALDDVSISVEGGSWIGLVGENGAGKSTLLKTLSGLVRPDDGHIRIAGASRQFTSIRDANSAGLFLWSQSSEHVPAMTLYENAFLGFHAKFAHGGRLDHKAMRKSAAPHIDRVLGSGISEKAKMSDIDYGQQQLFQLARILACINLLGVKQPILLIDEATAALDERQSSRLFSVLAEVHAAGATIVYVSHRLREIIGTAEHVVVMRDARVVGTVTGAEATESLLHSMMVGRERLSNYYLDSDRLARSDLGDAVLEATGISGGPQASSVSDVQLTVHAGEIVGVAGVEGSGKESLARLLSGADRVTQGEIRIPKSAALGRRASPRSALRMGIGRLPVDRLGESLISTQTTEFNITLVPRRQVAKRLRNRGWLQLRRTEQRRIVAALIEQMSVVPPDPARPVESLSGGNQQKVALAKWALADPDVLVAVDPTQGIDVGARQQCYRFFRDLCQRGKGLILVSNDLPELIGLANRVIVMRDGRVVGEVSCDSPTGASEEALVRMMVA